MRSLSAVAALLAGLALAGFALPGSDGGTTVAPPALRLVAAQPLQVRGLSFKPLERVRVRLFLDAAVWARLVRASRAGTFLATFEGVRVDRCTAFVVSARGDRGSRAALKSRDIAECPQPVPSG